VCNWQEVNTEFLQENVKGRGIGVGVRIMTVRTALLTRIISFPTGEVASASSRQWSLSQTSERAAVSAASAGQVALSDGARS
jgi:hypothetical protein